MNRKKVYLPTLLQICWDLSEHYDTGGIFYCFDHLELTKVVKDCASNASSKEEASYLLSTKMYGIDPDEASEHSNYTGFHYIMDSKSHN